MSCGYSGANWQRFYKRSAGHADLAQASKWQPIKILGSAGGVSIPPGSGGVARHFHTHVTPLAQAPGAAEGDAGSRWGWASGCGGSCGAAGSACARGGVGVGLEGSLQLWVGDRDGKFPLCIG